MVNFNQSVNLTTNHSGTSVESEVTVDTGVWGYVVQAAICLTVAIAWGLNILVLRAIGKIDQEKLKVKFLLINTIVGDMMLALSFGMSVILHLSGADEYNTALASLCANIAYNFYSYFAAFYQIFACIAVAFDRLYSIIKPLSYITISYNNLSKSIIFLLIFGLSFGFSFPIITSKLDDGDSWIMVCYRASERDGYGQLVPPIVIICSVMFNLSAYLTIFSIIVFHRRKSRGALQKTQSHQALRNQTSLAITFFLVHITYIVLYLPGALFHSVLSTNLWAEHPYLNHYLAQLTNIIYLTNTLMDPLIYIFRIRSVRQNLPNLHVCFGGQTGRSDKHQTVSSTLTSHIS